MTPSGGEELMRQPPQQGLRRRHCSPLCRLSLKLIGLQWSSLSLIISVIDSFNTRLPSLEAIRVLLFSPLFSSLRHDTSTHAVMPHKANTRLDDSGPGSAQVMCFTYKGMAWLHAKNRGLSPKRTEQTNGMANNNNIPLEKNLRLQSKRGTGKNNRIHVLLTITLSSEPREKNFEFITNFSSFNREER
jgi:hypothetical protein